MPTVISYTLLSFSFIGFYKFIKNHFRINQIFIPLATNLFLMIFLYFASIIGILQPSVWLLIVSSIIYFFICLIDNTKPFFNNLVNKIKERTFHFKSNLLLSLCVVIISISFSLSIISRILNFWEYTKPTQISLIIILSVIIIFPLLQILEKVKTLYKNLYFRIFSIVFFIINCIFITLYSNKLNMLPSSVDTIVIRNTGQKNILSTGNEINFLEVKRNDTKEKLNVDLKSEWGEIAIGNDYQALKSYSKDDSLIFENISHGPNRYIFLFSKSSSSGIVEIIVNGNSEYFDLYSKDSNQKLIQLSTKYNIRDSLIVILNIIFFSFLSQIVFYFFFSLIKNKEFKLLPSEKVVLFLTIFLSLFLITRDLHFYLWDEFSHWGIFPKELYIKNYLPINDICTGGPQYIPGISLYEYYFLKILGYKEGYAYFSYLFFIFSEIITFIDNYKKEKTLVYLLLFLSVIAFLFYLPIYFFSLYVDAALGLLFGTGLILATKKEQTKVNIFLLIMIYMGLQLIKTWGLIFAGLLCMIVLLRTIINNNKLKNKNCLFNILLFVGSVALVQVPWLIHILKINKLFVNSAIFNLNEWENSLNIVSAIDPHELLKNLVTIFINGRDGFGLDGFLSPMRIGIFLLFIGCLSSKTKDDTKIHLLIGLLYILNIVLLYFSYLFYFSDYEAINLASFERYISGFLLGWFLYIVSKLTSKKNSGESNALILFSRYFVFIIFVILFAFLTEKHRFPPTYYISDRERVNYYLGKYNTYFLSANEKPLYIFHIEENSNGFIHHILRYELCPNLMQYWGWSIGKSIDEKDIFTVDYSPEILKDRLIDNFNFVFITKSSDSLMSEYSVIFDGLSDYGDQLYKVSNGEIYRIE
jgi:hypothetical protein